MMLFNMMKIDIPLLALPFPFYNGIKILEYEDKGSPHGN